MSVKGFKVLNEVYVEDCASKGIYLVHERTGLQVFHLLNDDEENLFAFAFRTPSQDSTGAAHVLEHSVLCGSERYPLRDVFSRLANQNITTYLNAYTASDRTVFPASTTVRQEYFNLMSVYSDAVFFPLLRPEIFMQECCRLEPDGQGRPRIQGVVYNEMKGNYSSFDGVADAEIEKVLLAGTCYAFDSGGDPLSIPGLTLAKLRAFHRKYYCPANCLLFMYGNIPTEEQLEFVDKNILSRIKDGGKAARIPRGNPDAVIKGSVRAFGPAGDNAGASKPVTVCSWRAGRGADKEDAAVFPLEMLFLGELLWGDDCAPVAKALLESKLGEDLAPQTGVTVQSRYSMMTVGLRGVEERNARLVKNVIFGALESICRDGVSAEDFARACMTFEFSNREIKRFQGPYSLVLLRRALRAWTYGHEPWESLLNRAAFSSIKERALKDPSYIPGLIERYLLCNQTQSLVTVVPSAGWTKKREAAERRIAREMLRNTGKEGALRNLSRMREFQDRVISDEEKSLLPCVSVSRLSPHIEPLRTRISEVGGIKVFSNKENTNGIVYVDVAFAVDCLTPREYRYLSVIASACTQVGWNGIHWSRTLSDTQRITGGFGAYTRTSNVPECSSHLIKEKDHVGRDWLIFHFKALEEHLKDAFGILSDCLTGTDFSDSRRLKDLVVADYNGLSSSLIPNAHWYMMMRSCSTLNRAGAVQELWDGITSFFTYRELVMLPARTLAEQMAGIFARLQKGGAVIHITADSKGMARARRLLPEFIERAGLIPLQKRYSATEMDFIKLTELPSSKPPSRAECRTGHKDGSAHVNEVFIAPGTVGYAACAVSSSRYDTRECMADEVYAHCLENTELWSSIRTAGGAYGVLLSTVSDSAATRFMTYRDPKPFGSIDSFFSCLRDSEGKAFTPAEVEKAVTGCYSYEVEPRTPSGRGATAFLWELYGISNAQKNRRVRRLLSVTAGDLQKAAERYASAPVTGKTVVLCPESLAETKNLQNTSKIIKIPL